MKRCWSLLLVGGVLGLGGFSAADDQKPAAKSSDNVTFSEHIASMVFTHCSMCHRPGQAAPFSLLNYKDVHKHAGTMVRAISSQIMPPWQPAPGWGEFVGERRLTDDQIDMFKAWVNAGMPEGDPKKMPKLPEFPDGWQQGKPDQIVSMDKVFEVPEDGPDIYQNFVLPLNLRENKWVTGIEFKASAPSVVHHVLYLLDNSGRAQKFDVKFSKPGKPGFPGMGFQPTGSLGGWAVGEIPQKLPANLSRPLDKNSDLVLQVHFHPSGTAEKCQLTVALFYADKPSPRTLIQGLLMPPRFAMYEGLDIPPGKADYTLRDSFVLPADLDVIGMNAHAHYVGKSFKGKATLPDGTIKNLFLIKDWDFNWQGNYFYKDFIRLTKGTKLDVEIVYDNSADNPRNPNSPPKRIHWGEGTMDEMGSLIFLTVPANEADVPKFRDAIREHIKAAIMLAIRKGYPLPEGAIPQLPEKKAGPPSVSQSETKLLPNSLTALLVPQTLPDVTGKMQKPLNVTERKANVLFFVATDCPISNGYAPEIRSIVQKYSDKGIAFYMVHTDPELAPADARAHAERFKLPCPVIIDSKHDLVQATGVTTTPEVAVVGPHGTLPYRGRIDDQYPGLGKKRVAPAERNLRDALDAIVAGTPVKTSRTAAVGCTINELK
jgi:mono/diheme cytochrome c family protein